jgi:hypothetical protein
MKELMFSYIEYLFCCVWTYWVCFVFTWKFKQSNLFSTFYYLIRWWRTWH